MWNTIATFRENISQLASEVLDTAEELEISGSEEAAVASHGNELLHAHPQTSGAMLHYYSNAKSGEQMELAKKFHEEHSVSLPVIPQYFTSDLNSANWKYGLSDLDVRSIDNKSGKHSDWDTSLEAVEVKALTLQEREKDLLSQVSSKEQAYCVLLQEHNAVLAELERVKQSSSDEKPDTSQQNFEIQSKREALQDIAEECSLQQENEYQESTGLPKLHEREDEDVVSRNDTFDVDFQSKAVKTFAAKDGKLAEMQKVVSDLQEEKLTLQAEREKLLKDLHSWQQGSQMGRVSENDQCEVMLAESELLNLRSQVKEVETLSSRLKTTEEALVLEKLEYQKSLDAVSRERDKAIRDLNRLKQHLLDKELADSEKMDQDNEQIKELESRAATSNARVLELEQSLSVALANHFESSKRNEDELQRARTEVESLNQRLQNILLALDSKDVELANLQGALGQYYAESEAQERLYGELRASKEEVKKLLEDLRVANKIVEVTQQDKENVLEKLAQAEHNVQLSNQSIQKLEEDISRLRHALETSLTRLNRMSSDSDYYVDRRIVIKLLVTYLQRKHSKEVLDLMARILGFSEEDKQRVGLAQANAGKAVVKSMLGLPGRFVGGLLGSGNPNSSYVPAENQSFADLWIDFLLKESEERDRREREMVMRPTSEVRKTKHHPRSLQGSYNHSQEPPYGRESRFERTFPSSMIDQKPYTHSRLPESPRYEYHNHINNAGGWQGAENGGVSNTEPGDSPGREFLNVPLNSSINQVSFAPKHDVSR